MSLRIDLVFPRFKVLSGAERLILELAAALRRQGHCPRIVCHRFDDSCRPLLSDGVALVVTGARLDFFRNRYLNAAFDYLRVLGLARHLDPEADATVLFGPALWLVLRVGKPLVYHCFEPPRALYQDRREILDRAGAARPLLWLALHGYRWLDRWLVGRVGAVTASGRFAAVRVHDTYGADAIAITHGLDRARLDRSQAAADGPNYDLITVNFLHPRKRIDLLLRALARQRHEATLEVVGEGPERGALEALAERLGVRTRVRFAGFVPEQDLAGHYRSARCYVHTAREESFGLSVIEAAYCGLPVVAVKEGGVVDNVEDGVTGRLVPARPDSLAGAIDEILDDPQRAARMGAEARRRVARRYDWDAGATDLLRAVAAAV